MSRLQVLSFVVICACSKDAAIKLVVTPAPERPDSCFEVSVNAPGGESLASELIAADDRAAYTVLVYQGTTFPQDVELNVRAWVADGGCAEPRWANGEVSVPGRFTKGITTVEARLDAVPDSDGDHTVDAVDCAPDAGDRAQSLPERCNTRLDVDCDGFPACDDPDCAAQPCVATLALLDGGPVTAGECVSQTLTLFNAGEPQTPPSALTVALSDTSNNDVTFYGAPGCGVSVTSLSATGPTTTFSLRARRAGTMSFSASAANHLSASASYTVAAAAPFAVSLDAGTAWATTCVPISASWVDEFGNPVTGAAMQATSAQTPVFSDGTCTQSGNFSTGGGVFIRPADEGEVTVSVSAGSANGGVTLQVQRPFTPGMVTRWPLVVHTFENSPFNGYDGYTVTASFDAGVPPGQLRAFFWNDGGWHLVPRVASAGTVEFPLQTDLDAGADDRRYAIVAMDSTLDDAVDDLDAVYLFADDFEDPALAKWRQRDGGYSHSTALAYSGTGSLFFPQQASSSKNYIEPAIALNESDVMVCSRWRPIAADFDFSQAVRLQVNSAEHQEINREGDDHWALAYVNAADSWTKLGGNITVGLGNWDQICVAEWETASDGTTLRAWRNGVELGSRTIAAGISAGPGTVGYRHWRTNYGGVHFDTFRARRFILPEPSVTVGAPLQAP